MNLAVVDITSDLRRVAEQYASLEVADDPLWAAFDEESRERVRVLKLLGARQVHPVLLSAIAKFKQR